MGKHRLPEEVTRDLKKRGADRVLTMVRDDEDCWWGWRSCNGKYFIRRLGNFNPWSW